MSSYQWFASEPICFFKYKFEIKCDIMMKIIAAILILDCVLCLHHSPSSSRLHPLPVWIRWSLRHRPHQRSQTRAVGGEQHRSGRTRTSQERVCVLPQQLSGRCFPFSGEKLEMWFHVWFSMFFYLFFIFSAQQYQKKRGMMDKIISKVHLLVCVWPTNTRLFSICGRLDRPASMCLFYIWHV